MFENVRRIVKDRFTKGYDEQKLRDGKRDHSGEELFVKDRFTKEYTEQKLREGKRDHSGEELFVNELQLPVHKFPAKEIRAFHLKKERRHEPNFMKTKTGLASTITDLRQKQESKFRNTWLLKN